MAAELPSVGDPDGDEIQRAFADYLHPDNEHTPAQEEYHTGLLDREDAAELIEQMPEVDHADFYPPRAAEVVRELPDTAEFVVGREQTPVVYVWTNRAPLVGGLLRDAAYWKLTLGVVDEIPAETVGEEPCAKRHGEWCIVRACWE